jgi:hypothetical protein
MSSGLPRRTDILSVPRQVSKVPIGDKGRLDAKDHRNNEPLSVARHLKVSHSIVAAVNAYRPLPIRNAGSHPALGVQWNGTDFLILFGNFIAPFGRDLAAGNFGLCRWLHRDGSVAERV